MLKNSCLGFWNLNSYSSKVEFVFNFTSLNKNKANLISKGAPTPLNEVLVHMNTLPVLFCWLLILIGEEKHLTSVEVGLHVLLPFTHIPCIQWVGFFVHTPWGIKTGANCGPGMVHCYVSLTVFSPVYYVQTCSMYHIYSGYFWGVKYLWFLWFGREPQHTRES